MSPKDFGDLLTSPLAIDMFASLLTRLDNCGMDSHEIHFTYLWFPDCLFHICGF